MAREKSITAESLAALGAQPLAALLVAHAGVDAGLRKKLAMLLAGAKGVDKLADEIDKRLRTIGRSRSVLEWEKAKAMARELDHLRTTIVSRVAEADPARALQLLWSFVEIADPVHRRVIDGSVEDVFSDARADLGRLTALDPPADRRALARRVLAHIEANEFVFGDLFIRDMSEALGPEGRAEIRTLTQAALDAIPPRTDPRGQWARRALSLRLSRLADLDDDVDAYIAALRAGGMDAVHSLEVAGRLIAAGRPAEALPWLDVPRAAFSLDPNDSPAIDLRVTALDALDRRDEARSVLWRHVENVLSPAHLRDYLRRLPDFEDFEAEQKALAVAQTHADAHLALAFFLEWPALERADRLVRERYDEMDGRDWRLLRPAAEALGAKHPAAATLLYRRMIESVLDRGVSAQYKYAARDLAACEDLSPRLEPSESSESQDDFLTRLRRVHGRKYGFWSLVDP